MTEQELEDYYEGKGCICHAHNINDCACSHADWTPKEVYVLRQRLAELEAKTECTEEFTQSEWQPVSTIPEDLYVDIYVQSNESEYGKRYTCVCKSTTHSNGWVGLDLSGLQYIQAGKATVTHWMPIPKRPNAKVKE